ncbi:hypothetical protein SAY86_021683 [Trapa natans]|uniref:Alpha/beta hydrolase fold-3 domain-containing protein n=1 Tax=Trapa natans TaxID=22666 RepID=A0AAN7RKD7_TRANT|nr:hypothetical protein SAY86_021683 [Trapa natans]
MAPEIAPNSTESSTRYKSKDVVIDALKPITARLFVPSSLSFTSPVLVYFHGGGFCIGSTTWFGYHHFLGDLCAAAGCIVLSVDYRLAPEHLGGIRCLLCRHERPILGPQHSGRL